MKKMRQFMFVLILALLPQALFAADSGQADQCVWTNVERIVAVGDVHGGYDQLVTCLRSAAVIDGSNQWIAGKTHLVQTGDCIDRGTKSRQVFDLLMALEGQAAKAGGHVHALIGNHETMVATGYFGLVSPEDMEAFGGEKNMKELMSPSGKYGKWIRGHNVAIRINDILFVHGALSREEAKFSLAEINQKVRESLNKSGRLLSAELPMVWSRNLALNEEEEIVEALKPVFEKFNAQHIVIGHTVSSEGIKARAGGAVIMIDVGLSDVYGGPNMCLVVENGIFYTVSGREKKELKL